MGTELSIRQVNEELERLGELTNARTARDGKTSHRIYDLYATVIGGTRVRDDEPISAIRERLVEMYQEIAEDCSRRVEELKNVKPT